MPTIVPTPGAVNANSYETQVEAQEYFNTRLPLSGWDDADDQTVLLTMATRTLNALAQPRKILVPPQSGQSAYYRILRQWTGSPATKTQKLAWPRVGMRDANGDPIDTTFTCTVESPTIIETASPHKRVSGDTVFVFSSTSTPVLDGAHVVTVIDETHFSVEVEVTVAGEGFVTWIPQELKDAESELAGQLGNADRTLDNDVIVQGLTSVRAGSVSLSFKDTIFPQVIPDAVFNLMPLSWLTDELYEPAQRAMFDVVSEGSQRWPSRSGEIW